MIQEKSKMLLKLKLSKVNLNDRHIIDSLCDKLTNSEILGTIDLSWTSLTPRELLRISESIQSNINVQMLRELNLSYNSLIFGDCSETVVQPQLEIDFSNSFIESFVNLLTKAIHLNHIDFSGMSLSVLL